MAAGLERLGAEASGQEVGEDGIFVDEHRPAAAVVYVVVLGRVADKMRELLRAIDCACGDEFFAAGGCR